jgi:hypothetical protein
LVRNPVLQLPEPTTARQRRNVLGAAIGQLERADLYLAAVTSMELGDRQAAHALNQLRSDLRNLRRHLGEARNQAAQ